MLEETPLLETLQSILHRINMYSLYSVHTNLVMT